jgi:hypothetical protein
VSKSIPLYFVESVIEPIENVTLGTNDANAPAFTGSWYAACANGTAWTGAVSFKFTILIYFELLTQSPVSVILPVELIVLFLSPITLLIKFGELGSKFTFE